MPPDRRGQVPRRRTSVLVALAVAVIAAAGHFSTGSSAAPTDESVARTTCTITKLADAGAGYGIRAFGYCKRGGYAVPGRWSWSRVAYDVTGASCGIGGSRQKGAGQLADESEVPYRLVVTFHLAPIGPGTSAVKNGVFVLGDSRARCAPLESFSLPAPSQLCAWAPPDSLKDRFRGAQCGVPPGLGSGGGTPGQNDRATCGWISGITISGGTVSAGAFACTGGDCTTSNSSRVNQGFFGYPQVASDYVCGFLLNKGYRMAAWTIIAAIQLVDPSGATCQFLVTAGKHGWLSDSFEVPPNLGGTLSVAYALQAGAAGFEYETNSFSLHGTDGCNAFHP